VDEFDGSAGDWSGVAVLSARAVTVERGNRWAIAIARWKWLYLSTARPVMAFQVGAGVSRESRSLSK
jgi:hypothetical protein